MKKGRLLIIITILLAMTSMIGCAKVTIEKDNSDKNENDKKVEISVKETKKDDEKSQSINKTKNDNDVIKNTGENSSNNTTKNEYELEYKNGERTFKSEVVPYEESEKVILDALKVEISDEYDKFKDIYVQNDIYLNYPKLYKENLEKGKYTEKIVIHSLKVLSKDEYSKNENEKTYYDYMDRLETLNPKEFKIVEVKYTNKLSEKQDSIAQFPSGTYTRYYVVVKENEKSNFKIFDIYGHLK